MYIYIQREEKTHYANKIENIKTKKSFIKAILRVLLALQNYIITC